MLDGNRWQLSGSMYCGEGKQRQPSPPALCFGGVAKAQLRKADGSVLGIVHGK
ncbi:MAG: hypothetical protein AB7O65_08525 [Candidatus Korobacteraceae bacterium]